MLEKQSAITLACHYSESLTPGESSTMKILKTIDVEKTRKKSIVTVAAAGGSVVVVCVCELNT